MKERFSSTVNLRITAIFQTDTTAASAQPAPNSGRSKSRAHLLFILVFALILSACTAFAEQPGAHSIPAAGERERSASAIFPDKPRFTLLPDLRLARAALLDRARLLAQTADPPLPASANANLSSSVPAWGTEKSYLIPALEIIGFDVLLNLFDRAYYGCCDYDVDFSSIKRNLHRSWKADSDEFTVNQLGHPYQGSIYHGFARASGLNYWQGLAYTFVGSAFWEIAGETTRPSTNDQINTGIGGSFLGEALFRMSNLWLEQGRGSRFWRELVAAAISPPVGFNRLAFGDRFGGIFPSKDPEYYSRIQVGIVSATQDRREGSGEIKRHEGIVDFALDYGLPGKHDYTYDRPFDYFSFQVAASTAIGFESVSSRGLLLGTDYDIGKNYRGIWGLYGSYSYWRRKFFVSRVPDCRSGRPGSGGFPILWHCREQVSSASATPASATSVIAPTKRRITMVSRPRHSWRCGLSWVTGRPSTWPPRGICRRCIRGPGPSRQRDPRGCVAHVAHSSPACGVGQIPVVTT